MTARELSFKTRMAETRARSYLQVVLDSAGPDAFFWGAPLGTHQSSGEGDLDESGAIGVDDLLLMLNAWGDC